jgi:hypothetical protein
MEPLTTTTSDSRPALLRPTGAIGFNASQPPREVSLWARIHPRLDLVAKLLPVAWSVFLLLGGLIFLFYFWSIGFMPELDLNASLTLLAVSAITGSFLFLMVVVIFLLPSAIWINMLRTSEPLKKALVRSGWQVIVPASNFMVKLAYMRQPHCFQHKYSLED